MSRTSEVRYYPSKGAYMTTYRGVRYKLLKCDDDDEQEYGPNYRAAIEAFNRIKEQDGKILDNDQSVWGALERFMSHLERECPGSMPSVRSTLGKAQSRFSTLDVAELIPKHVLDWIDSHKTWGPCTRWSTLSRFRQAMRYNENVGIIRSNPLAKMKCPRTYHATQRGADFVIPPELLSLLIDNARGRFQDYLKVLASTGARPGELCHAEYYHYSPRDAAIVFEANPTRGYVHKTARRKKRGMLERVIYLNDECNAIVARNARERAWLFPNERGTSYKAVIVNQQMALLKKRRPVREWMERNGHSPSWVVPYSFRHTWITEALKAGKLTIKTIADLVGNSVSMIELHYSHAASDRSAMRTAFLSAK